MTQDLRDDRLPLRMALVGCGRHSRWAHAAPLRRYAQNHPGHIELAAACDLDRGRADRFQAEFGFRSTYDDLEQMLDEVRPVACICIMPVDRIVEVTSRVLERGGGMAAVVEKPLGHCMDDALRLAEIARRSGAPNMVSVNRRFIPHLNRGLAWARAQQSPLRRIRATMLRNGRTEPEFLWATGIHAVDVVRYLGGIHRSAGPPSVRATTGGKAPALATWYTIDWTLRPPSDFPASADDGECHVSIAISPTAGTDEESYELAGDRWRVLIHTLANPDNAPLRCWRDQRLTHEEAWDASLGDDVRQGAYAELEEFVSAMRQRRMPNPCIADVLESFEICDRILRQANSQGIGSAHATS